MTPKDVIKYFSKNGNTRGAYSRFARFCNFTPAYASKIINAGVIPASIQFELQVRTFGELKVDDDLLSPELCDACGSPLNDQNKCA